MQEGGQGSSTKTSILPTLNKISKANALVTSIPNGVGVFQENDTENPKFCTEISFVPRQNRRGELTTRECIIRGCSSQAGTRASNKYGTEVKCLRGYLDFLAPNINRDGSAKVARNCERQSNIVQQLVGRTTRLRTGIDAIAILGCVLGTEWFKRSIELLDTIGITNDPSNASVENCVDVFIL